MNIRNINLNLLIVLNALLTECHVTKAGEKIHLSQSAMSNSLKQLREIFGDELLQRGQSGNMKLTKKAESLRQPVAAALNKLQDIFQEEDFDPAQCESIINIGMSDYIATILSPALLAKVQQQAPKVQIVIKHFTKQNHAEMLERQNIDLAIGVIESTHSSLMCQHLFNDNLVCMADEEHPAFQKKSGIKLAQFLKYPHVLITSKDNPATDFSEVIMSKLGKKRRIPISLPYSIASLVVLRNSNYISILPERFATLFAQRQHFVTAKVPFKIPEIQISQLWDRYLQTDPLHQWIRRTIKSICEEL